jgi:hypothetical protein
MPQFDEVVSRAHAFKRDAHALFGQHESAPSRAVNLNQSYKALHVLNVKQDDLFRQAFRCVENELFRAAHVMAWAAFIDFYEELLQVDDLSAVRAVRPKWDHCRDIEELREYRAEAALLELAQPLRLTTKNEMKALQSLLNKRNQCAHPSSFAPDLNTTLGFLAEVLHYVRLLDGKRPIAPDGISSPPHGDDARHC